MNPSDQAQHEDALRRGELLEEGREVAHLILCSTMSGHFPPTSERADETIAGWTDQQVDAFVRAEMPVLVAESYHKTEGLARRMIDREHAAGRCTNCNEWYAIRATGQERADVTETGSIAGDPASPSPEPPTSTAPAP